jgi:hypothetical protein
LSQGAREEITRYISSVSASADPDIESSNFATYHSKREREREREIDRGREIEGERIK